MFWSGADGWANFVELNCLDPLVDEQKKPLKLWENHTLQKRTKKSNLEFKTENFKTVKDMLEFFDNSNSRTQKRAKLITDKLTKYSS